MHCRIPARSIPVLLIASLGAAALTACGAGVTGNGGSESRAASTVTSGPVTSASRDTPAAGPTSATLPSSVVNIPSAGAPGAASSASAGPGVASATLPADFPLPPGARTLSAVRTDDELDAHFSVTDAASAYAFWRDGLPGHGYRVGEAESLGSTAEIDFTGHGCVGGSQLAIHGSVADLQCDLS